MNNFSYFSKALDEVVDARLDDYVETLEVDKRYEFSEKYNKNKQTYKTQRKALFYSYMHDRQTCCLFCYSIVDPIIFFA